MRIAETDKIMEIEVVDHIIVVGYKAFNFKGRGLI